MTLLNFHQIQGKQKIVIVSKNLLKSINILWLRLLIIYHLGYALRVTKYSFGRWYIDER